jgi:head-tail adaptor
VELFLAKRKSEKSMAYQSGFRSHLVTIRNKVVATTFGETTHYEDVVTVHAAKTWKHGAKALQEGALDAYDKVLFRMNWNEVVRRDSLLVCEGKTYQVLSLDGEFQRNEIEILAQEIVQGAPAPAPSISDI